MPGFHFVPREPWICNAPATGSWGNYLIHAYTYATSKDTGNTALQMALYVIAMHVSVETGKTFVGIRTLMAEAKVKSDRTMRNYIARLEKLGFIKREKRTRTNGSKTTDCIELCGFLEWFKALRGADVVRPPAKITGGGEGGGGEARPRQELPEGTGSHATGGSGNHATGPPIGPLSSDRTKEDAHARAGTHQWDLLGAVTQARRTVSRAESARAADEIAAGTRLPFSTRVIRELTALDIDLMQLVERYLARTNGRKISDPSAYLLKMGQDAIAKQRGIPVAQVKAIALGRPRAPDAQLPAPLSVFTGPSVDAVERARRWRNPFIDAALAMLKGRQFRTLTAADRAFELALSNARFSKPGAPS